MDKFNIKNYYDALKLSNAGESEVVDDEKDAEDYKNIKTRHINKINYLLL
tara:strand:+ start:331 stop:480 length:150 start_codon:yes stop_codon:yes gene_type:complete